MRGRLSGAGTAEDVYLRLLDGIALPGEQLQEMMQDVLAMVERMGEIIEHMRVFSRDTSQEPGSRLSLNGVAESALKLLWAQLRNHGIGVEVELAADLPVVMGHAHQLEQVVVNLLTNARDALDALEGGTKHLAVRSRQEGDWAILEVEDSGVGMDEETQARVFEPFFTTKPANRGTGLGLSVSHAIVEDHGGNLRCRSQVGKGAVFQLTVPAFTPETAGQEDGSAAL